MFFIQWKIATLNLSPISLSQFLYLLNQLIEKYFNENADIVNAKQLLEALETNRKNYQNRPFVLIASIETKMNLKTF